MTRVAYVSADRGVPIFGRKGCSLHAQEVLLAMLRHGASVEVITTSVGGEPPAGLERLEVHALAPPAKGEPAAREQAGLAGNKELRDRLAARGPFDFVYERYSLWSYAGMEFAREAKLPGLLEVNAPLIEEQAQYRVLVDREGAERVAHRAFAAASALLAVSDEVANWLDRFSGARGKIHVVPNGIRPERFPEGLVPALPAPPGVFTVGFVGTLKAWHGLSVLVDAFARLRARHRNTRLLIVGDGPERERIEADLVERALLDVATLTGSVPPAAVPALLASMDAAVAPYPALEHFYFSPLKVYEYMAAGLPVVASRVGQLQKLIDHRQTGLLVTPGEPAELAGALEELLRDPALRAVLGRAARKEVLHEHTWDAVAQKIFALARCKPAEVLTAPPGP